MKKQTYFMTDDGEINFKGSFFGVKKRDVMEYIAMQRDNLNKAHEVFDEKLAEIKSENELVSFERDKQREKIRDLEKAYHELCAVRDELIRKIESRQDIEEELKNVKDENIRLREENEGLKIQDSESRRLRKQIAESDAVSQVKDGERQKLIDEIEALKKKNKEMLSSHLEEKKKLETENAQKYIRLVQLMRVHRYNLQQSRTALEALTSQFGETCESAQKIDPEWE